MRPSGSSPQKSIIRPDGHEYDYRHIADKDPFQECWDTVQKAWVDSAGWHQYQVKIITWAYPSMGGKYGGFVRMKISPDGDTSEAVFAQYGYPEEISPLGPGYRIAYRQK